MDPLKLKFVNEHDKGWKNKYNEWLWEYFSYHGVTPNGEPLTFIPTEGIEYVDINIEIKDFTSESE